MVVRKRLANGRYAKTPSTYGKRRIAAAVKAKRKPKVVYKTRTVYKKAPAKKRTYTKTGGAGACSSLSIEEVREMVKSVGFTVTNVAGRPLNKAALCSKLQKGTWGQPLVLVPNGAPVAPPNPLMGPTVGDISKIVQATGGTNPYYVPAITRALAWKKGEPDVSGIPGPTGGANPYYRPDIIRALAYKKP